MQSKVNQHHWTLEVAFEFQNQNDKHLNLVIFWISPRSVTLHCPLKSNWSLCIKICKLIHTNIICNCTVKVSYCNFLLPSRPILPHDFSNGYADYCNLINFHSTILQQSKWALTPAFSCEKPSQKPAWRSLLLFLSASIQLKTPI